VSAPPVGHGWRRIVGSGLLLVALGALVYGAVGGSPVTPEAPLAAPENGRVPRVIVAYFHGGIRCDTCDKLEAYAEAAVKDHFAAELASGEVAWRTLDMERAGNTALVDRFGLYTKSVVLVALEDGEPVRWENLRRVWDLVHDHDAYEQYVVESLRAFLRGGADG